MRDAQPPCACVPSGWTVIIRFNTSISQPARNMVRSPALLEFMIRNDGRSCVKLYDSDLPVNFFTYWYVTNDHVNPLD
jgi:hypothetical protein